MDEDMAMRGISPHSPTMTAPASSSPRIRHLLRALARATTYDEWRSLAEELDILEDNVAWQGEDPSEFYDDALLRQHLAQIRRLECAGDFESLIVLLRESLYRHLPDLSVAALYDETRTGETKHIVSRYLDETVRVLDVLCDVPIAGMTVRDKLQEMELAARNFGRSTLMLSGGATWGIYHLGVVHALHKQDLLPKVICGSSMGAIVAASVCTRNDAELDTLLTHPESIHREAFRLLGLRGMLSEGAMMDPKQIMIHIRANARHVTFAEALAHSGRILNISVSPTRQRQKPRVLCYLTAPNVLVCSATAASCAVPGLYAAATLSARGRDGQEVPYLPEERWADGSFGADLPMSRLSRLHNINHFIVSQSNPHVVPFVPRHARRKGLVARSVRLFGAFTRAQAVEVLDAARRNTDIEVVRRALEQAHALAEQEYFGHITIYPHFGPHMYARLLVNPTEAHFREFIIEGERATWPKLAMVRAQTRIATTLEHCIQRLRAQLDAPATVSVLAHAKPNLP
jgi:NTE family protein